MNKIMLTLAAVLFAFGTSSVYATSDVIRIVGSSTVYPFTTTVAEQFAKKNGVSSPIVEATGTGGGIKMFCAGNGPDTPDAVNASRKMKDEEKKICAENGVENITEMAIGIDAIVVAMSKDHPGINLSTNDIYRALAKYVVVDGKFVENSVKTWNEVRSDLPSDKIEVLGPPPTSGTRDSFVELVFEKECKADIKKNNLIVSEEDTKAFCQSVREDGAYIEAGENDNLIVQKLQSNPAALGIFGYSFLEENLNTIQGATINDVAPEYDAIAAGNYPIARKLYVYFKGSHFDSNPDLKKFMDEYQSDEAIGEEGYLAEKGLIPLK
jgi:phosphate transport system substrate-binding protein